MVFLIRRLEKLLNVAGTAGDPLTAMANDTVTDVDAYLIIASLCVLLAIVLFIVQSFIYILKSFRLLIKHLDNVLQLFSNIERKTSRWLRVVPIGLSLLWLNMTGTFITEFFIDIREG